MEAKSANSSTVYVDQLVVPGDVVLDLSTMTNQTIKLGGGLRQDCDAITVIKAGKLRFSKPNKYWVESSQKWYVPSMGDNVLGVVVDTKADDTNDEELCYSSGVLPKLQFRKDFSKACWNDELEMTEIVDNKGRMWTTTGIVRGGRIYCSIEETLFLAEIGALHLLQDNVRLSLEEIYKMVAGGKGGCCWESFEVYRHMKSLGYVVGRHGVPWTMRRVKYNSVSLEATEQIEETLDKEYEDKSVIAELFKNMHIDGAKPMFDVYPPNSMFKKSSPGNPSFVLCLTSGYPPSKAEVENLERRSNGIPLKFCHVEHGRVSFFSFDAVELPLLH